MNFDLVMTYAFYALLVTTVWGSVYLSGLLLLRRRFKTGYECLLLNYLRIGGLIFLLPVLFAVILWKWGDQKLISPWMGRHQAALSVFGAVPEMVWIVRTVCFLWGTGMIVMLVWRLMEKIRLRRILKYALVEGRRDVLERCERMREFLGIHKSVMVLRSNHVSSPCMTGIFRLKIVLPYKERDYGSAEQDVIFAHELMHCKRHDVLFRKFFMVVNLIHVLNPLAYLMRHYHKEYAEIACDIAVCAKLGELFTAREYSGILLGIAVKDGQILDGAVAVTEKEHSLRRRVEAVIMYEKGRKPRKRTVALLTALLVMGSSMTAYAAGNEMVKLHMNLAAASMDIMEEEACWVNTLPEQYISAEEFADYEEGGVITDDGTPFMPRVGYNFNVRMTVGGMYESSWFELVEGQTVTVMVCTDPSGQTVQAGLKYKDGTGVAVTGVEPAHQFTAPQSGSYCFFVRNLSNQPVTAYGMYKY